MIFETNPLFQHLGLKIIVARAMQANLALIRVLEKTGMQGWKDFDFEGSPGCYYLKEKDSRLIGNEFNP